MENRYFTPLRYPGGKSKLTWLFENLIQNNHLEDPVYIEPYAGGAGIGVELLIKKKVSRILINDLNSGVYSFWDAVLHHTDDFCKMIEECSLSIDSWHEQKNIIKTNNQPPNINLGFAFFYLNRTNRSGIINGGAIGGKKQDGKYKIDARFDKKNLIERIQRISNLQPNIKISNCDAEEFICKTPEINNHNTLTYIDPPYFNQGKRLYDNFYTPDDHKKISECISKIKGKWVLSYDKTKEIESMYERFRVKNLEIGYTAAKNTKGNELLIFSDNIYLPESFSSPNRMTIII